MNHFIFRQNTELVNITTKKVLPANSSNHQLKQNFFLKGQEQESIEYFLFSREKTSFAIDLIPTWECNLRCKHCFVLHELLKKDDKKMDSGMLLEFVNNFAKEYPNISTVYLRFVGGEPTLRASENVVMMNKILNESTIDVVFSATSNGMLCDEDSIEFFSMLKKLNISLDGPELIHNSQRKSISDDNNPFNSTIKTIEKLVSLGMRDKIKVQASLNQEHMTKENLIEFYKVLLMRGIKFENITAGFVCPTNNNPKIDEEFISIHRNQARVRPCCKYRHMENFVVDNSNNVYCDYFEANSSNLLGRLSDPISEIARNHERIIRASFPVLNDPKCQKCPVIGLCWGWCANTKGLNPSDHCDQQLLIRKVKENAEKNNLVNFMKDTRKNDLSKGCKNDVCGNKSCLAR